MALNPCGIAIQAAFDGNLRLLKKMAGKVDLREVSDRNGGNVLHFAAAKGRVDVCAFLVEESGLDVNSTTAQGETPVAHAAIAGKVDVLRYLLDRGGDPAMPDSMGATPLHDAADHDAFVMESEWHHEAARLLLSRGVDVDPIDFRGTPLHLAAGKAHDQVVKVLLEHCADPNRVFNSVFSPLMLACCECSLECVKLLVEAGADVNFRNPYVPTALTKAAAAGLTGIVKFLLEAGANPNISDELGKNAIIYAAEGGLGDVVEILFPWTKSIVFLPDWSVDGIINAMKCFKSIYVLADAKLRGNEAFAKGDYRAAIYLYDVAMSRDPFDATLFANRSLCWLRLRDGNRALLDAQLCKNIRPRWSKAWYRAVHAFAEALKLDPASDEIKKSLRQCS
uniref:Uncharacterized protein n=1 Tax=Setaria italica TaxID=4555 RepID=K3ZDN6_SETIT